MFTTVMKVTGVSAPLNPSKYAGPPANYGPTWSRQGFVRRFFKIGMHAKF